MSWRGFCGLFGGVGIVLSLALGQVTGVIGCALMVVLACKLKAE